MELDKSYSPDVEIDHEGDVVYCREIAPGENITIPFHIWEIIMGKKVFSIINRP